MAMELHASQMARTEARRKLWVVVLGLAVLVSALAVVYVKYQSRRLFVEFQSLQNIRDDLEIEWGQLQLEQSTWLTQGHIENIARTRLGMVMPSRERVVIVKP